MIYPIYCYSDFASNSTVTAFPNITEISSNVSSPCPTTMIHLTGLPNITEISSKISSPRSTTMIHLTKMTRLTTATAKAPDFGNQ